MAAVALSVSSRMSLTYNSSSRRSRNRSRSREKFAYSTANRRSGFYSKNHGSQSSWAVQDNPSSGRRHNWYSSSRREDGGREREMYRERENHRENRSRFTQVPRTRSFERRFYTSGTPGSSSAYQKRDYDRERERERERERSRDRERGRYNHGYGGRRGAWGPPHPPRSPPPPLPPAFSQRRLDKEKGRSASKRKESREMVDDDDAIVHFKWKVGDTLCYGRYRLTDTLGDGTFGRCLEAVDTRKHPSEKNYRVAIKVVRDVQRYTEAAQIEADILEEVAREDRKGESRCVELLGTFMHGPHYCFVFERLGESLFEFLKANDYRGFCVQDIQVFARQTLECLRFLHSIRLTHTDLKPENILLVDSSSREITFPRADEQIRVRRPFRADIKVIDFGGATFEDEKHTSIINTRQYRAPEVILGCGWSMSSDIWSFACIVAELYSGEMLFGTHENLEHLAMMERLSGGFPAWMVDKSLRKGGGAEFFDEDSRELRWPSRAFSSSSVRAVEKTPTVQELVCSRHRLLADFVSSMLIVDPNKRPTADEALRHPFLSQTFSE